MAATAVASPDPDDKDNDVIDVTSRETPGTELVPTTAEIVPVDRGGGIVRPAASLEAIVEAFREYLALEGKLLVRDDYQQIGSKQFKKKSAYRKFATAFNVSTEIKSYVHTRDADGRIVHSEFIARATAPGGRYVEGFGACGAWDRCTDHYADCVLTFDPEKPKRKVCDKHCGGRAHGCDGFHHYSKPEHDIPATAQTRAFNRAQADLFAMGEVSAEEVDRNDDTVRGASPDEIRAVREAAKAYKDAGGEPGVWPIVLGVRLLEKFADVDENGDPVERTGPAISSADAAGLVEKLESLLSAAAWDGGGDTGTPDGAASPEGVPVDVPAEATTAGDGDLPAVPAPLGVESDGSAGEPGDDGVGVSAPESSGEAAVPVVPPAPGPRAAASKLAGPVCTPGERARIARGLTNIYGADGGACARHALALIVTDGRTRTTKELTSPEARVVIRASKLLESGHLLFAVDDEPDGPAAPRPLPAGEAPAEDAVPTLVSSAPAGSTTTQGDDFIAELGELLYGVAAS